VATHSQSGSVGHHMVRILKEKGQLNKLKGLLTIDGVCSFANSGTTAADYLNIPYLAIRGYYPGLNGSCVATVDASRLPVGKQNMLRWRIPFSEISSRA
jgi:hypothetical protein